jgi:hypothetical protein
MALAIPRDTVLARGKVWVDRHVPYSQTRYAKVNGSRVATNAASAANIGYRTDCSGFVSMCLGLTRSGGLPKSLDSSSLRSVLATIPKASLQPGDVILRPKGSNVAYGHAVIFVRWADDDHTKYWSYEESSGSKGTVTRVVPYPFFGESGFKPYRYKQIDDFYSDVEYAIFASTRFQTAAKAVDLAYPAGHTVGALVVANGDEWTGNVSAAALASACGGPLLLTEHGSLPSATSAEIKRLKPARVYIVGGQSMVADSVAGQIAKLAPHVTRVSADSRYALAASVAKKSVAMLRAKKHTVDTAYLIGRDAFCDAVAVAPVSARTGRPVFIVRQDTATKTTLAGLKASGIKHVIIIGGSGIVGPKVVAELKKQHLSVARIFGADRYTTALKVAQHGAGLHVGLTWSRVGVSSGTSLHGMLACAIAQGESGALLLYTPADKLHPDAGAQIAAQRAVAGKVRVYGSYSEVEQPVRASIAKVLRAAK